MGECVYTAIIAKIPECKSAEGGILTAPFLECCRLTVPVIDQMGKAFYPAKADVSGNIERLAKRLADDPENSQELLPMLKKEMDAGVQKERDSCCRGLLWLKRFLEFVVGLVDGLLKKPEASLSEVATDAYGEHLRPYHGFMASSAFSLVLKVLSSRDPFVQACGGTSEDMQAFVDKFTPLLKDVHQLLVDNGLNDTTPV
eukprot:CAMPEP_0197852658 /NCGR_PEP_ID=MMETSP1438-20131217/21162_1 /TAXON_ID=1461541 /ORGANISM="Pterosperma sp., Strain CCMP1384" /LENGTH=199 /DNA_ID=CAMNT_0043466815 /DNA_START=67 /DNA_END=666 /DNA_ORIENTATION=+